jgi:uncharacterized membrane protein YccC
MSAGGSIRATVEYVLGTFAGAVYASSIYLLFPHNNHWEFAATLAIAIGPLAYAAASSPVFRVAPFTAVIVLLLAGQFGESPISAALIRLLEVAFGGAVAVGVSLLIFPERAHGLGQRQAVAALEDLAHALPELLSGFARALEQEEISRVQGKLGASVTAFTNMIAEAEHERRLRIFTQEDPGPLSRTLLRLRHDLVIIGRAAANPLPAGISEKLIPLISDAGAKIGKHLIDAAGALDKGLRSPPSAAMAAAFEACASAIAALREEGQTRSLSGREVEQLFALGFALDQLRENIRDLDRCVNDWARF